MIRSFLKGGIFYKTPQLHENASISKDSDIVNKWYVDTKVNNTQINTKQYVDTRVASIPIVDASSLVNISGNQNINGTKYFNSSPTVPNPTSGTHAANKAYVDSKTASDTNVKTALNASGSAPIYACRAWVNFNGTGTVAIRASGNVSSIIDNRTGIYTVNFTTSMPDENYSVVQASSFSSTAGGGAGADAASPYNFTSSSVSVTTSSGGAIEDLAVVCISIMR